MQTRTRKIWKVVPLILAGLLLAKCVEDYPGQPLIALGGGVPEYSVTVQVSGILGSGIVLSNGNSTLEVGSEGTFTFPAPVLEGSSYQITVQSTPDGIGCTVNNASGVATASISNVTVNCYIVHSISVIVEGLDDPGLVLVNGTSTLTAGGSGTFPFPDEFQEGSAYNVIIQSTPAGYQCAIANSVGTLTADVSNVEVDCIRVASLSPGNRNILNPGQTVTVVFNREITGCTVDITPGPANLGPDAAPPVLATTNVANDTLQISPAGVWGTGTVKQLTLNNCQSADGSIAVTLDIDYIVLGTVAYVRPGGTDVGMCNTEATSCATINYAINQLVTLSGCNGGLDCAVLVAEGTYDLAGITVSMAERVSILGSFSNDFTNRFPSARSSILSGSGGPCLVGRCHVNVPAVVTSQTAIEGFTIQGDQSGGLDSSAVQVLGSIRLTDNTIRAGNGTNLRVGLNLQGNALSVVTVNRFESFDAGAQSLRAVFVSSGALDLYLNQIVLPGAVMTSEAVVIQGGNATIHTNGIYTGAAGWTTGIQANTGMNVTIAHNLILNGQATVGAATGIDFLAAPVAGDTINNMIIGNLISVQSRCIRDSVGLPGTHDLFANNLISCPDALLQDTGVAYTTICNLGVPALRGNFGDATCALTYGDAGTVENLASDPVFVNPGLTTGDFRYSANSPCSVAQGGVNPVTYALPIRLDADLRDRPGPDGFHSIGPYEPQFGCVP